MFPWQIALFIFSIIVQSEQAARMRRAAEKAADAQRGLEVVVEGKTGKTAVVYGRAKVGGLRVWHGLSNDFKFATPVTPYHFITGAGVVIGTPATAWVGGDGGTEVAYMNGAKPSGTLTVDKIGDGHHEFLFFQQVISQGGISGIKDVIIDDYRYLSDPDINTSDSAIRIDMYYDGGVADPIISANFPERSTATFNGLAYASVIVKLDRKEPAFSSVPAIQFLVEGRKVYTVNPVTYDLSLTRVYSNNPAYCLLDYLLADDLQSTPGKGLSVAQIDLHSFYDAAQICDTLVKSASTGGGQAYTGGKFWLPTDGSSSTTLRDLPLYECNLAVDTDKTVRENIEIILSTMGDAKLVWSGGQYKLNLTYAANMTALEATLVAQAKFIELTDADLVQDQVVEITWPSTQDRFNYCNLRYKNESEDFKEDSVAWPPKYNSTIQRGVGGNRYRPAKYAGDSNQAKFIAKYGVWHPLVSDLNTCSLTYKFKPDLGGVYTVECAGDDHITVNIAGVVGFPFTRDDGQIYSQTATLTGGVTYLITVSGINDGGAAGIAARLYKGSIEYWSTLSVTYDSIDSVTYSQAVYLAMLAEDHDIELETEVFADGVTDYYHAQAKAEELVRTSRSAYTVKFKYVITDNYLEPGDLIKLSSNTLNIEATPSLFLKVIDVKASEDMTAEVTGTHFDTSQLAWNVLDNYYKAPPDLYAIGVPQPVILDFTTATYLNNSSGTLGWSPVNIAGATYILYAFTGELVGTAPLFNEIGRTSQWTFEPLLPGVSWARFGVRAVTPAGRMSEMTVTPVAGYALCLTQVDAASITFLETGIENPAANGILTWNNPSDIRVTRFAFYRRTNDGLGGYIWEFLGRKDRTLGATTTILEISGIPAGVYTIAIVSESVSLVANQTGWPTKVVTITELTQTALPSYATNEVGNPLAGGKLSWAYNSDVRVTGYSVRITADTPATQVSVWETVLYIKKPVAIEASGFTIPAIPHGGTVAIVSMGLGTEAPRWGAGAYLWNVLSISAVTLTQTALPVYTAIDSNNPLSGGYLTWAYNADPLVTGYSIRVTSDLVPDINSVWNTALYIRKPTVSEVSGFTVPVLPNGGCVAIVSMSDSGLEAIKMSGPTYLWNILQIVAYSLAQATGLSFTPAVDTALTAGTISWTNSTDIRATSYAIYVLDGSTWNLGVVVAESTGLTTSYTLPFTSSGNYTIAVAARAGASQSAMSGWPTLAVIIADNALNTALLSITSDNILSSVEKHAIRQNWDTLYTEKISLDTTADLYTLLAAKSTYTAAFIALGTYLNGGISYTIGAIPPSWISDTNILTDTVIVGATFRSTYLTAATARSVYLTAIDSATNALANVGLTSANTAQSIANTALSNAAIAQAAADVRLRKAGGDTLTGIIDLQTTTDYNAAVRVGSVTWDATTGAWLSGTGVVMGRKGLAAYAGGATPTFVLDATTGSATFSGTLNAATGTFGAVTVSSTGSISSGQSAYATGTGFWLESNTSTPRFSIGDGVGDTTSKSLRWTGTDLYINGTLASTVVLGAALGATALHAADITGKLDKNAAYVMGALSEFTTSNYASTSAGTGGLTFTNNGIIGHKRNPGNTGWDNQFVLDTNGNATFSGTLNATSGTLGTITAGTITGATVQTAASGARIALDNASLKGYNAAGFAVFELTTIGTVTLRDASNNVVLSTGSSLASQITSSGAVPTTLAALDSTASTKLSGIAAGATAGATWGTNISGQPTTLAALDSTAGTKLSGIADGATVGAIWGTNISGQPANLAAFDSTAATTLSNKLSNAAANVAATGFTIQTSGYAGGNGVALYDGGLIAKKASVNQFVIGSDGTATFSGALSAATGSFAGTISAASLDTTGHVKVDGNTTDAGYTVSGVFNTTYLSAYGVHGYGSRTGVRGDGTTYGIEGYSAAGVGVAASSNSGTALTASSLTGSVPVIVAQASLAGSAIQANAGTGFAIECNGPLQMASTNIVANGTGTATWTGNTKPTATTTNAEWLKVTIGTVVRYIPCWQ